MKQIRARRLLLKITILISGGIAWLAPPISSYATGYFGPTEYLPQSQQRLLASPEFYWEQELLRIAREFPAPEKLRTSVPFDSSVFRDIPVKEELGKATAVADNQDFATALQTGRIQPPDAALATQQQEAARKAIENPTTVTILPEEFPSEFADYHRGAFAYTQGKEHWEDARTAWENLLKRPVEERSARSVWAAFMLGKLAMKSGDYPTAIQWFHTTRELAKKGFADSLGMAADSYGWEGRCEWKQNDPEKAARMFLTQLNLGDKSAIVSLKALIPDRSPVEGMLNYGAEPDDMSTWSAQQKQEMAQKAQEGLQLAATSPLLQRLVTAHILATASGLLEDSDSKQVQDRCSHWLQILAKEKSTKLEDTAYLGWLAYIGGNYEDATRWLTLSDPNTAVACWLQSKLDLRAGRIQEAAQAMSKAWRQIIDSPTLQADLDSDYPSFSFPATASGDFSILRLAFNDFVPSMQILLRGHLWSDAAYLAERVLTTEELKSYVDQMLPLSAQESAEPGNQTVSLRWVLGRRLVREDRYAEAAQYLKPPYDKVLQEYVTALDEGANEKLPKLQRARAYFHAAWIARFQGMELMGTEGAPDGFISGGDFEEFDLAKQRASGQYAVTTFPNGDMVTVEKPMFLKATKQEIARLTNSKTSPNVRFHYRSIAGEIVLRAAKLLNDNTENLADILNTAGQWTKSSNEPLANRIYAVLSKRGAQTKIGKAAIAKHWFVTDQGAWSTEEQTKNETLRKELGIEKP